jgi:hypothetical protein
MGDDDRVVSMTVRLDPELHRTANRKMIDDGQSFPALFEAAVVAHVDGRFEPIIGLASRTARDPAKGSQ